MLIGGVRMIQRDYQVLEFVELYGFVETSELVKRFYSSQRNAQKHLKRLTDNKLLKRKLIRRDNHPTGYIYFMPTTRATQQIEHLSYVAKFVLNEIRTEYQVLSITYERTLLKKDTLYNGIRCDAIVTLADKTNRLYLIIEVERSHNALQHKIDAYTYYFKTQAYLELFPHQNAYLIILTDTQYMEELPNSRIVLHPLSRKGE